MYIYQYNSKEILAQYTEMPVQDICVPRDLFSLLGMLFVSIHRACSLPLPSSLSKCYFVRETLSNIEPPTTWYSLEEYPN